MPLKVTESAIASLAERNREADNPLINLLQHYSHELEAEHRAAVVHPMARTPEELAACYKECKKILATST